MGLLRVGHDRDFTFTFHFHALEKEMATHSSVLAWRITGTGEPGGLPSLGSHRVGHDWSDLAAAAAAAKHKGIVSFSQVETTTISIPNALYNLLWLHYIGVNMQAQQNRFRLKFWLISVLCCLSQKELNKQNNLSKNQFNTVTSILLVTNAHLRIPSHLPNVEKEIRSTFD